MGNKAKKEYLNKIRERLEMRIILAQVIVLL